MQYRTIFNNLIRYIEAHQILFYSLVMFIYIIYCIFGIYPFYKNIMVKRQTMSELVSINTALENKKSLLVTIPQELEGTDKYLTYLRTAIPSDPSLQTYLIELSTVSARSGFQQQRVSLGSAEEGVADIAASLTGSITRLPVLLSEIESMKRITEVVSVSVTGRDNIESVSLNMKVHYME